MILYDAEIESKALYIFGFYVEADGIVRDGYNGEIIYLSGRRLVSHVNGVYPDTCQSEILFSIYDVHVMRQLYQLLLANFANDGIYIRGYHFEFDKNNRAKLVIQDECGMNLANTKYYANESLRYLEAVYQLNSENIDLTLLDIQDHSL